MVVVTAAALIRPSVRNGLQLQDSTTLATLFHVNNLNPTLFNSELSSQSRGALSSDLLSAYLNSGHFLKLLGTSARLERPFLEQISWASLGKVKWMMLRTKWTCFRDYFSYKFNCRHFWIFHSHRSFFLPLASFLSNWNASMDRFLLLPLN